ncbi:cell division protein PerM [Corynebacterium uterequi]|uniref:Uncharacterized protein n=1 Tax=Corynebacterium uterequi TaxID=1072256 RepID=A0A0G3HDB9_9CORY|nr:DUF6350 family protein [Corynebacterium uterequi]AKK10685.1 hypothetical protein CUTER_03385 [Corynebacterium uterequi]
MSTNTSPKSRLSRRSTVRRNQARAGGDATAAGARPTTIAGKLKRYLPAVGLAVAGLLIALLVLVGAVAIVTRPTAATVPAALGQLWLLAHAVPITVDGTTVGVLPLTFPLIVIVVMAQRVRTIVRAKVSVVDLAVIFACVLILPLVLSIAAWALLDARPGDLPVTAPLLAIVVGRTLLIHLIAAVWGVGGPLTRAVAQRYGLPGDVVDGWLDATRFLRWLSLAGLVFLVVLAAVNYQQQIDAFHAYPKLSAGAVAGVIAVTLAYLPNAIVGGVSVLLGGDVTIGPAMVSLFGIHLVALPPMPLFALIPASVPSFASVLALISALVAAWVAASVRPGFVRAVSAGVGAAVMWMAVSYLASGVMGEYGWTGPTWWLAPALAGAWCGGLALAAALGLVLSQRLRGPGTFIEQPTNHEPAPEASTDTDDGVVDGVEQPAEEAPQKNAGDDADADEDAEEQADATSVEAGPATVATDDATDEDADEPAKADATDEDADEPAKADEADEDAPREPEEPTTADESHDDKPAG